MEKRDEWYFEKFSWWDASCDDFNVLIKVCLKDPSSFKEKETTVIDCYEENKQSTVNAILSSMECTYEAEEEDYLIMCSYTHTDLYGSKVEGTAIGIASYLDDNIIMLYIE